MLVLVAAVLIGLAQESASELELDEIELLARRAVPSLRSVGSFYLTKARLAPKAADPDGNVYVQGACTVEGICIPDSSTQKTQHWKAGLIFGTDGKPEILKLAWGPNRAYLSCVYLAKAEKRFRPEVFKKVRSQYEEESKKWEVQYKNISSKSKNKMIGRKLDSFVSDQASKYHIEDREVLDILELLP